MKRKMLIVFGSVGASILLLVTVFSSTICAQSINEKPMVPNRFHNLVDHLSRLKGDKNNTWYPGLLLDIIIAWILILIFYHGPGPHR